MATVPTPMGDMPMVPTLTPMELTTERGLLMRSPRLMLMPTLYGSYGAYGYGAYPYGGYAYGAYPYTYGAYYGKRSADAEPKADADAYLYGAYGYGAYPYTYGGYAYGAYPYAYGLYGK